MEDYHNLICRKLVKKLKEEGKVVKSEDGEKRDRTILYASDISPSEALNRVKG